MESLFVVNVRLPHEYKEWINDMLKVFVLLASIHVMQYVTRNYRSTSQGLFNADFWRLVLFIVIGFSAYYLVVRKVIRFRYLDEHAPRSPYSTEISFDRLLSPLSHLRSWLKNML